MIAMFQNEREYAFPAIFFKDGDGVGVKFPDLEGCVTCADDYGEAVQYAKEALGGWILSQEDMSAKIPAPSPLEKIHTEPGDILTLVSAYPEMNELHKLKLTEWDDVKDMFLTPEERAESDLRVAKMVKAIDARNARYKERQARRQQAMSYTSPASIAI